MKEEIQNIKNQALSQIMDAADESELEELRIRYLGRSGKLSLLIKEMSSVAPGERKIVGSMINEAKDTLTREIASRRADLKENVRDWFDPTRPGTEVETGHLHLVTQAIDEIERIFTQLGFIRRRYPEADWDWYAFTALNFAPDHPARDNWETFWVDTPEDSKLGPIVLTPHTSNGQVREMQALDAKPPIRMINIGKTYRRQSDVSHTPMFHQFEGLVVDSGISIAHLKGTLEYFVKRYFGPDRVVRVRPHDFPFTEPSFEVDISCDICQGRGCRLCKEGWLELAGAGMVHPNVLKAGGIDPKKYTGFAFGTGVERVLMMRTGLKIADLRTLYSTDLRYLKQF